MEDSHLLHEILEQPEALRRVHAAYVEREYPALNEAARLLQTSRIAYFSGMATSDYASWPASILLSYHGKANFSYDVSELLYYHRNSLGPDSCMTLVSQSGNSAEITHILDELKGKLPIVGVYNNENSALAKGADIGLPILAGPQRACGSKTNLTSIAVLLLLAERTLGHELQQPGEMLLAAADAIQRSFDSWEAWLNPAADFLEDSAYTVFLGRGPARASAMFTSCLFREVPKVVAEGMGAAAFRHGLREMIRPAHRVVIFAPQSPSQSMLIRLAKDLVDIDIPVMMISNSNIDVGAGKKFLLIKTAPQPELWAPLVDMVPMQLTGYLLAKRYGLEPGKLVISTYVTSVE
ncbi:MAG TPA: SIS domain-containing protein [Anaerolineales bacterium]|nr:SIS domain-containing protein [Anaerolineales bacterium]